MIKAMILAAAALTMGTAADAQTMIQKNDIKVENQRQEPEGTDHGCKERNRCCLDSGRTEDCLHPRRTALEHEP